MEIEQQTQTQLEPVVPQTIPPPAAEPTPPKRGTLDIASRQFILIFSIGAVAFWLLEFIYQYTVLTSHIFKASFVDGSAITGATFIAAALFSSAIFKWHPQWAQYWRIRRYLGVSGFLFILMHVYGVVVLDFSWNLPLLFFSFNPIENPIVFGAISFIILFVMAVVSSDWAVRKLGGKRWKFIHRFVYIAFASALFHYALNAPQLLNNLPGYLMVTLTGLAVFGQLFWFFKTIKARKYKNAGTYVGFAIILAVLITAYLALKSR